MAAEERTTTPARKDGGGERIATTPAGPRNDSGGNTDCHGRRRPRNDKKNEITVVGFLIRKDGSTVPMDEITPEEREEWLEGCRRRLTQRMSDWFAQHPEELAKL